jgi:hypothetical protein
MKGRKMSEYSSKLRDPRWQRKRLEIFEAAKWKCEYCGEETKELHAHHLVYKKGHSPWEYEDGEIIALCKDCHEVVTSLISSLNDRLMAHRHNVDFLSHVCGYIDGFDGEMKPTGNISAYYAGRCIREIQDVNRDIRIRFEKLQRGDS